MNNKKTDIRDPLLRHIIGGVPHGIKGLPSLDDCAVVAKNTKWKSYLTYVVQRYFNILRYPCHWERRLEIDHIIYAVPPQVRSPHLAEKSADGRLAGFDFYSALKPEHYEASLLEFDRLYKFTQEFLTSEYFQRIYKRSIMPGNRLRLGRGVFGKYAAVIMGKMHTAERLSQSTIEFKTDIVSFYASKAYYHDVEYYLDVDFKDIILSDDAVIIENGRLPYCEGDFFVVNPNPTGILTVNTADIICKNKNLEDVSEDDVDYSGYYQCPYIPDNITIIKNGENSFVSKVIKAFQSVFSRFFSMLVLAAGLFWAAAQIAK